MLKSAKLLSVSFLALACVIGTSASAQIVSSGSLREVDPWGVGWKNAGSGNLSTDMWSGTSAQTVYELLGSIDAQKLTAAQKNLLRAIVLSGGKAPSGHSDDATSQRLRLLRELGENAEASNLLQRFPNETWSEDPHTYEAEQDFATGNNKRACAAVEIAPSEDTYWQSLRAACFALAGNMNAANLSAEMAISSGQEDPWLFDAISALEKQMAGEESKQLTPANYSSGTNIALSLAANLSPDKDAITSITPEYAALLSIRPDAPEQIQIEALLHAARAGLIDIAMVRSALISPKPEQLEPDPALTADQPQPTDLNILRNPLEHAVDSVTNPNTELKDKAVNLLAALIPSHGDGPTFSLYAKVLLPELKSIPQTRDTAPLSPSFVEAALGAGDIALAKRWRDTMDNTFDEPPIIEVPVQANTLTSETLSVTETTGVVGQPVSLLPINTNPTLDEQLQALNAGTALPPEGPLQDEATHEETQAEIPQLTPILHSDWDKARLDMLILLASSQNDKMTVNKVVEQLVNLNEQHPIEVNQYLSVLSGLGYDISPESRSLITSFQNKIPSSQEILADYELSNALRVGAIGEASIRALLTLRDTPPKEGGLIPFTNSLYALCQSGLKDIAQAIAYETLSPWNQKQS